MNKIDEIINSDSLPQACIDGKWVAARPENYKKSMTSFFFRFREALNVMSGKAETLYYHGQ